MNISILLEAFVRDVLYFFVMYIISTMCERAKVESHYTMVNYLYTKFKTFTKFILIKELISPYFFRFHIYVSVMKADDLKQFFRSRVE